jgi:hypothetical protein
MLIFVVWLMGVVVSAAVIVTKHESKSFVVWYDDVGSNDYQQVQYLRANTDWDKALIRNVYPNTLRCATMQLPMGINTHHRAEKMKKCYQDTLQKERQQLFELYPALRAQIAAYDSSRLQLYCSYKISRPVWIFDRHDSQRSSPTTQLLNKVVLAFSIEQRNCTFPPYLESQLQNKGGTSMEIVVVGEELKTCSVVDLRNGTYDIHCLFSAPMSSTINYQEQYTNNHSLCIPMNIVIDFEFFEGFREMPGFLAKSRQPLRHVLWSRDHAPMCFDRHDSTLIPTTQISSWKLSDRHLRHNMHGSWQFKNTTSSPALSYVWTAEHVNYSNHPVNGSLLMFGASHMRYMHSFFVAKNYDVGLMLGGKPSEYLIDIPAGRVNNHFSNSAFYLHSVQYHDVYFQQYLIDHLQHDWCDAYTHLLSNVRFDNETIFMVLQYGSWDLTFSPVQQSLMNVDNFVNALKMWLQSDCFKAAPKNANSNKTVKVRLIFLSPPPYPNSCRESLNDPIVSNSQCNKSSGASRNNYAIAALVHALFSKLGKFLQEFKQETDIFSFRFVDMFSITLPRLIFGEAVGTNHFLYREYAALFETPAGIASLLSLTSAIDA